MSELIVRFWGTRGSIPTPGSQTRKYGGNTTCLELRYDDTLLVFDAGSGIRPLGNSWGKEFGAQTITAHLLFTHAHWDHIQGFPFFTPAYRQGNTFTIWGEDRQDGGVRELLSAQMQGPYFPVPFAAMQAQMTFERTTPFFEIGPISIRTIALPHPGGCLGYRLEVGRSVFILATDCELDKIALNQDSVLQDHNTPRHYDPEFLAFFRGANMLVIDAQYTDAEYQQKRGWGHNSLATVVDFYQQTQPDVLVLCHHDPESTDDKVSRMVEEVYHRLQATSTVGPLVLGARERLTMRVAKPLRPLALP
jgi:phosphoribosyl 1,2-cyclic phosphodiesterase